MRIIETDSLVIGAGLAGSAYALHAAAEGLRVALLSAGAPLEANSDRAQGGIIFDTAGDCGTLAQDIDEASEGTANPVAVQQLIDDGPGAVRSLLIDTLGVDFDRKASGLLDFAREGGHRERRIIHAKDTTGHAILEAVVRKVAATEGIARYGGHVAVDLLTLSHNAADPSARYEPLTCFGCYCLDVATGEVVAFIARKTVLATGGLGGIFQYTTNEPGSVGNGIAMAYRVGARLIDLEYVQFHPTVHMPAGARPFLISEALRGEGAVITDGRGRRIMDGVHPMGSLAPRDVVARAIHRHLAASGEESAYLDLSALDPGFVRERFPAIHAHCLAHGLDIPRERIPVVPAAHFSCGGVHTDIEGRTSVRNLNAIGETACTGLHGANRLASTSLLECLVGAQATATADIRDMRDGRFVRPAPREWRSPERQADPLLIRQDLQLIQQTMWNYSGIIRSARRLARARRILLELREDIQAFYRDCRPSRELIELRNAAQTALLVVHAATLNPTSKGCHYLDSGEDAPGTGNGPKSTAGNESKAVHQQPANPPNV
jgi:L-aspartate oxidase